MIDKQLEAKGRANSTHVDALEEKVKNLNDILLFETGKRLPSNWIAEAYDISQDESGKIILTCRRGAF